MLLLHGHNPLTTTGALRQRLLLGLGELFHLQRGDEHISIHGEMESLEFIKIDVSHVHAELTGTPPLPGKVTSTVCELPLQRLEFNAAPVYLGEGAEMNLHVRAESILLAVLADAGGRQWLALKRAEQGRAEVDIQEGQMEKILLDGLRQAVAKHKITVDTGEIALEQLGPTDVRMQLSIQAHKAFLKGTIEVGGHLRLDAHLNIHPTRLSCVGHGMLGKVAVPFLTPHLAQWEAHPFPLLGHAFGEIVCHEPRITLGAGNALHVEAEFGSLP